jgi:hypothetical protein
VVQRRHRIQKPHVVAQAALVQITEVRIQRIVIEGHIFIRIARRQPGFLHADGTVMYLGRQLSFLRFEHPVIAIVGDGADQLLLGNRAYREFQVVDEPVLGSDRPRCSSRIVFVIIHDDHSIRGRGDCGVVEFLVVRRHADIQLHPSRMQVRRKLVQQRHISRLSRIGEGFEVHHDAAKAVGGKKHSHLFAKYRTRLRIIQKSRDVSHPVRCR